MKALITGITGFVGSHLADYLLGQGIEVHGLIRWRSPKNNIAHIIDRVSLHQGDLLDRSSLDSILERLRPEYIFHLAAQSYVDYSFIAPTATMETNIIGTLNLLETVKRFGHYPRYDPVVFICSSSEVYGQVDESELPITEDAPFRPMSPYAVSKVAEDMLAYQYFQSWGIRTIRARSFAHEGPRRGEPFALSNFAKQIASIELNLASVVSSVVRVGNLDSTRTYTDVRDMVQAYWLLVTKCEPGEVYNIGGCETVTVGQALQELLNWSQEGKDIKIEVDPSRIRPSDVTLQVPSVKKFQDATGWKPEIKFKDTLKDMLNYWRKQLIRGMA